MSSFVKKVQRNQKKLKIKEKRVRELEYKAKEISRLLNEAKLEAAKEKLSQWNVSQKFKDFFFEFCKEKGVGCKSMEIILKMFEWIFNLNIEEDEEFYTNDLHVINECVFDVLWDGLCDDAQTLWSKYYDEVLEPLFEKYYG